MSLQNKSITFFMLVTNQDCIFAKFGVRSFEKIYTKLNAKQRSLFKVYVYLNNISDENRRRYLKSWNNIPYLILFDNKEKIADKIFTAGEIILSPEGIERLRDSQNENYDELWTSHLPKFNTDYIATVDADFEILDSSFYFHLLNELENPNCLIASTCYTPSHQYFDTYSNRNIHLHERNHTWFCIYKKEAFILSRKSHFYYEERSKNGEVQAYDSAAYFQAELRAIEGKKFAYLPSEYKSTFIHYGAGSKNKSLNNSNIYLYRMLMILLHIGPFHKKKLSPLILSINKITKKITSKLFRNRLALLSTERSVW